MVYKDFELFRLFLAALMLLVCLFWSWLQDWNADGNLDLYVTLEGEDLPNGFTPNDGKNQV